MVLGTAAASKCRWVGDRTASRERCVLAAENIEEAIVTTLEPVRTGQPPVASVHSSCPVAEHEQARTGSARPIAAANGCSRSRIERRDGCWFSHFGAASNLTDQSFDLLPAAAYVRAPDGTILHFNRRATERGGNGSTTRWPGRRLCVSCKASVLIACKERT